MTVSNSIFAFSAKSIQSFVLGSDRLRDMVGATALIDGLSGDGGLLPVLKALEITESAKHVITSAAGGARVLLPSDLAEKLASVWPMFVAQLAPGLECVQTVVDVENENLAKALSNVERQLAAQRQLPPPPRAEITPFVLRSPRSGLAAVATEHGAPIDAATFRKLASRKTGATTRLFKVFGVNDESQMPQEFTDIAGDERSYLAVIHADGNGLGQLFIDLGPAIPKLNQPLEAVRQFYHDLSSELANTAEGAAKEAWEAITKDYKLPPVVPLLPIVLAGDDLTIVTKANLAFPFLMAYLPKFGEKAAQAFARLKEKHAAFADRLPNGCSAGAGIAFVKAKYPFWRAYNLCESIAAHAKTTAKKVLAAGEKPWLAPATLAFCRLAGSAAVEDYGDLVNSEMTTTAKLPLTLGTYFVGGDLGPQADALQEACFKANKLPSGGLRETAALLHQNLPIAEKHFSRLLQKDGGRDFAAALETLGCASGKIWSVKPDDDEAKPPLPVASPIDDILTLRHFDRGLSRSSKSVQPSQA